MHRKLIAVTHTGRDRIRRLGLLPRALGEHGKLGVAPADDEGPLRIALNAAYSAAAPAVKLSVNSDFVDSNVLHDNDDGVGSEATSLGIAVLSRSQQEKRSEPQIGGHDARNRVKSNLGRSPWRRSCRGSKQRKGRGARHKTHDHN